MVAIKTVIVVVLGLVALSFLPYVFAVGPTGASLTSNTPETAPNDTAGSASAFAGNITELSISGYTTTQSWQGFYGNVSGTIQLADSTDNVFYNWSLAEPSGEVYASTNNTINWGTIQCFNFTANGTQAGVGGETAGATNIGGLNLTQLETRFNISYDDVDGVNETFSLSPFGDGHNIFFTASQQFSPGECLSAKPFADTGAEANNFEEALLYEPTTGSVVFASLLEEGAQAGFDTGDHDFEMLVLENGHGTDVSITTYFFFVELE